MRLQKCAYCDLPIRIHFANCQGSGIRGPMPEGSDKPSAIHYDPREIPWITSVSADKIKPQRTGR